MMAYYQPREIRFVVGMPYLMILLHVTFIINETFLSNCQNVNAKVLFRLMEVEENKGKDSNVTVFLELLQQIGSTKPPPTDEEKIDADRLLGGRFNVNYQSKKKPNENRKGRAILTQADLEKEMDNDLSNEQFKVPGVETKRLHTKAKRHFRLFLQQLSHCELSYQWKDLGHSVWPRYIKETYCVSKGCSYPAGMTCQRSESGMIKLTLLYWTCHARVRMGEAKSCGWSMVHINAISQCSCTCGDNGYTRNMPVLIPNRLVDEIRNLHMYGRGREATSKLKKRYNYRN